MVNEKGETEKHKRDESPRCLNCNAESIRFCPFCETNIVSSEDELSPDYDNTDEENDVNYRDKQDDTPPKVNKFAFRMAYKAIPDNSKL
ncbi:13211_t:CDS:2 [Funneliformis mosseae]|uniref:13211_t:CDS:1 n=1 Tax=Funneliformis mosseae TaxID=27381 RepID=A0A9N8ZHK4_FUNMO|nr:13211_t:CDS:2 [Funneliformis mosseae]